MNQTVTAGSAEIRVPIGTCAGGSRAEYVLRTWHEWGTRMRSGLIIAPVDDAKVHPLLRTLVAGLPDQVLVHYVSTSVQLDPDLAATINGTLVADAHTRAGYAQFTTDIQAVLAHRRQHPSDQHQPLLVITEAVGLFEGCGARAWAEILRWGAKVGVSVLACVRSPYLTDFGNHSGLRDLLACHTVIAPDLEHIACMPGMLVDLNGRPPAPGPGWGLLKTPDSRNPVAFLPFPTDSGMQ
jgi:hypothetical protein